MYRLKITFVYDGKVRTFDQLAEGESKDEFRARAVCALGMPEGATYHQFEVEGYRYRGPVHESVLGMRRVHHVYAPDERLPGLFQRAGVKVVPFATLLPPMAHPSTLLHIEAQQVQVGDVLITPPVRPQNGERRHRVERWRVRSATTTDGYTTIDVGGWYTVKSAGEGVTVERLPPLPEVVP